jgi:hypothetical protein
LKAERSNAGGWYAPPGVACAKLEGDFLVAVRDVQRRVAAGIARRKTRGRIGYLAIEPGLSCIPSARRLFVRRAASRRAACGATDWTRAFAAVNYVQAVEPFLKTDRLSDSERVMLMGGACAKAYGWSPKRG